MAIQTNLTQAQVQSALDALRLAMLSGTLKVQFADGKSQEYQSTAALLNAITAGEDLLREMGGQSETRCSFGQTKRGDGPQGAGRLFDTW
jgi:hypothetical protein